MIDGIDNGKVPIVEVEITEQLHFSRDGLDVIRR